MGFTIANYSLYGLQPQTFYISIRGCYTVEKNTIPSADGPTHIYSIRYIVYYSSSKHERLITENEQVLSLTQLPTPADIYTTIYANIKASLGDVQTVDD